MAGTYHASPANVHCVDCRETNLVMRSGIHLGRVVALSPDKIVVASRMIDTSSRARSTRGEVSRYDCAATTFAVLGYK